MSNEVAVFDPAQFKAGMANIAKGATAQVGFLKMDKTGGWNYGADEIDVTEQTVFVDPMGFVHGWQCWADTDLPGVSSELLGDIVVPMHEPLPPRPDKVPQNGRGWNELRGLSCVYNGMPLKYSTTSVGGCKAIAALAEAFMRQYDKAPTKMIAEVQLLSDSYKHKNKTYGKVYVPMLEVVGWHAKLPAPPGVEAAPAKKVAAPAKKLRKAA